jgi:trimeric autotransporter adhesin
MDISVCVFFTLKPTIMSNKSLLLFAVLSCLLASRVSGQANTSLSNLANPTAINRTLAPGITNTYSLGTNPKNWATVYIKGPIYFSNVRMLTASTGNNNFWAGANSGNFVATGTKNTGLGANTLFNLTSGYSNSGLGMSSLYQTTTGYENTAAGLESGFSNTTGYRNTYIGFRSGWNATSGVGQTFVGAYAGFATPFSQYNSGFGYRALYSLANINYNSAFGAFAAESLGSGGYNCVFGYNAMHNKTSGDNNSVFGSYANGSATSGSENTYIGSNSGTLNRNSYNTFVGSYSGAYVKGSENTFIGYHAAGFADSVRNSTALGYYTLISASNQVRIGDYRITSIGGFQPWTNLSDGRFKKDIQENVPGLEFINKLRPITYTWKKRELNSFVNAKAGGSSRPVVEDDNTISTGFIAQEVEAAAKELKFVFDGVDAPKNDQDLYGLRYAEFVVPLVKAVQELSRKNDEKDSIIAVMMDKLNELGLREGHQNIPYSRAVLGQNYPNPVRQSTVITYTLPDQITHSEIAVTDASGKTIKRIVLGNNQKGNITLDMGTLPSGIYNYSLFVDGKIITTKKLTVVR